MVSALEVATNVNIVNSSWENSSLANVFFIQAEAYKNSVKHTY